MKGLHLEEKSLCGPTAVWEEILHIIPILDIGIVTLIIFSGTTIVQLCLRKIQTTSIFHYPLLQPINTLPPTPSRNNMENQSPF